MAMKNRIGATLASRDGAFDLPSILVAVVAVGVLTIGVLASIFGVIPFAQDKGAQQDLSSVVTAEGVEKAKTGSFVSKSGLESSGALSGAGAGLKVYGGDRGWFCASTASASGRNFMATSKASNPVEGVCKLNWTKRVFGFAEDTWAGVATSSNNSKILAARGAAGPLYLSGDSGATWSAASAPSGSWTAVTSSADGSKLFAVQGGAAGTIYRSLDSGATWQVTSAPAIGWTHVSSSDDGTRLIASSMGNDSYLYSSADAGVSWTKVTSAGTAKWKDAVISGDGSTIVAAPMSLDLKVSVNFGGSWTNGILDPNGGPTPGRSWTGVAATTDGLTFIASDGSGSGALFISKDGGVNWVRSANAPAGPWAAVAASNDGSTLLASKYYSPSALYASYDGGKTWTQQTAPAGAVSASVSALAMSDDGSAAVSLGATGIWTGTFEP